MRAIRFAIFCVLLILPASAADASAIVYEQLPGENSFAMFNSSTLDGLGNPPGFTAADDFILVSGAVITDLSWWGRSQEGGDDFVVTFYADGGGAPGAVLHTTGGTLISGPDSPGTPFDPVTRYSSTLAAPFVAVGGTTYWISIFNSAADASWNWLVANLDTNGAVQGTNPGPPWDRTISDLSFQLQTSVPEPATIALIGAGLAGLGSRRRHARRR